MSENQQIPDTLEREFALLDASIERTLADMRAKDAEIARLKAAAAKVCEGFDLGFFVRDISRDSDPAWAIKLFPYIQALGALAASEDNG